MRILAALFVALALLVPVAGAVAHDAHHPAQTVKAHASDFSCSKWASSDPAHPGAPGTYRSYGCSNPAGDWAWVIGTGYSGTVHSTKLQRVCVNNTIFGCLTYAVYAREHYHS